MFLLLNTFANTIRGRRRKNILLMYSFKKTGNDKPKLKTKEEQLSVWDA